MTTWLVAHNHEIGIAVASFIVGVVFAAWRQVSIEDATLVARYDRDISRREQDEWPSPPT